MSYDETNRIVIHSHLDVDLETLVQQAMDDFEASSAQELIDDLHDIPSGLPVAGRSVVNERDAFQMEAEDERPAECEVVRLSLRSN